jgi:glycosyltransferase involved in cell wall biosynthesis
VRTYNRPEFLERALASLAAQTYRNLEIVVVNDGGVDVSQIVGRLPNARYVGQDKNRGTSAAANAGLGAATGTYLCLLDDDDIVFPEHVSVLVAALLESGASIAHSDTISAHFQLMPDGEYRTTGYAIFLDGLVEPTDFYVTDSIGPMSVLMKRAVAVAAGGFDESLTHAEDWELFLKLCQIYDFVHVPRITGMYSIRHDGTHMMSNAGPAIAESMQRLIELHPLPHRPVMEAARRASLDKYRKSGYAMRFPEPALKRE